MSLNIAPSIVNGRALTVDALGFDTGAATFISPDCPQAPNRPIAKYASVNAFMVSRNVVIQWDAIVGLNGPEFCIIGLLTTGLAYSRTTFKNGFRGNAVTRMWMIRADGGRLYGDFRQKGIAAIGWTQLAHHAKAGMTKKELVDLHLSIAPEAKEKMAVSVASQVWRFMNEIKVDDLVVTYSPASRTYLIGKVTSACESRADLVDAGMPLARTVVWQDKEINRDDLTDAAKTSLGSMLAVFVVPTFVAHELLGTAADQPVPDAPEVPNAPAEADSLLEMEWSVGALQQLEWKRFEMLCVWYYEAKGFTVETVPQGADGGVDATLYMKGRPDPIALVQCKAWNAPVKVAPVRALGGVMHAKKVERGIFWSLTGFVGKPVKDYAEEAGIQLLDGADIVERIRALDAGKRDELLTRAFEGDYQTPTCAACGIKMVVRQGDGGSFWGCHNFPKGCRVKIPRAA